MKVKHRIEKKTRWFMGGLAGLGISYVLVSIVTLSLLLANAFGSDIISFRNNTIEALIMTCMLSVLFGLAIGNKIESKHFKIIHELKKNEK